MSAKPKQQSAAITLEDVQAAWEAVLAAKGKKRDELEKKHEELKASFVQQLAEEHIADLDAGKQFYESARQKFKQILALGYGHGDLIPLAQPNTVLEIQDQFHDKDIVWKPAGVERFIGKVRRATNVTGKL